MSRYRRFTIYEDTNQDKPCWCVKGCTLKFSSEKAAHRYINRMLGKERR